MPNDDFYLDNDEQSVVIIMTSGPSTAHRCATPFYLSSVLASMDVEVNIFFTMEAVKLCQKGVPENLVAMEGGKTIIEFMREAKSAGAKFHLCVPALPGYKIDPDTDIIDEVDDLSGAGSLGDLILSSDKVITF